MVVFLYDVLAILLINGLVPCQRYLWSETSAKKG